MSKITLQLDWVCEEIFALILLITTNNLTYNSNIGSKLDFMPIFKHGKQKLTIKKNDYSVQSELIVLDHLISKRLNESNDKACGFLVRGYNF